MSQSNVGYTGQSNGINSINPYAGYALQSGAATGGASWDPNAIANASTAVAPGSFRQGQPLSYSGLLQGSQPTSLLAPAMAHYVKEGYEAGSDNFLLTAGGRKKKDHHSASEVVYATLGTYTAFLGAVVFAFSAVAWGKYRGRAMAFTRGNDAHAAEMHGRRLSSYKNALDAHGRMMAERTNPSEARMPLAGLKNPDAYKADARAWLSSQPDEKELMKHYVGDDKALVEHNGWWHNATESAKAPVGKVAGEAGPARDVKFLGFMKKGADVRGMGDATVTHDHGEIHVAMPLGSEKLGELESAFPSHKWEEGGNLFHVDFHTGKTVLEVKRLPLSGDKTADEATLKAVARHLGADPEAILASLKTKGRLQPKGSREDKSLLNAHSWEDQYEIQVGTPGVGGSKIERKIGQTVQRYKDFGREAAGAMRDAKGGGNRLGLMLQSSTLLNAVLASTAAAATIIVLWYLSHRDDSSKHATANNATTNQPMPTTYTAQY